MKLAFCLYKYFPFGGMQRDFLRIARECRDRGHAVRVYVLEWEGEVPDWLELVRVPVKALGNTRRYRAYSRRVAEYLCAHPVDRVVGFNKMPGLDRYYAADPCFEEKARTLRGPLYRFGGRYRHFSRYEQAVFEPGGCPVIMIISPKQQEQFQRHYGTEDSRFHLLPPGITPDRRAPSDAAERRRAFRRRWQHADDDMLLLQVGSDFVRKGLERSVRAMAALPAGQREKTWLYVIGKADSRPFARLARRLGVEERVRFLGGRDDVPDFLLGADLLLHPARDETGGIVLVEAMVAGLPVIATELCGFAHHVSRAQAGVLIPSPFEQSALDTAVEQALGDPEQRHWWQRNGLAYGENEELYRSAQRAADIILEECR